MLSIFSPDNQKMESLKVNSQVWKKKKRFKKINYLFLKIIKVFKIKVNVFPLLENK